MKTSNNKIIIIGASSGIGRALAALYLEEGHQVGITGRRNHLLQEVAEKYPGKATTACFDVQTSRNTVELESIIERMGGMDLFIYNAGYGESSRILDWSIEKDTFEINAAALHQLVHFAFNYFLRKGRGQIAVTSSIAAIRGNSMAPAYSATKAFASTYCEGLSIMAARTKLPLYITDIQPGFVKTAMAKGPGRFWESSVEKAAKQIKAAIDQKKKKVYITRRWALIALLMKILPYSIYKRLY